ncbi:EamA family transporter [Paraconexibacter sp.]|uniref:EamA family transporter n=1 Tax=Paraconexibacter sp. TaxID=2949640 RepID=UPI0035696A8F
MTVAFALLSSALWGIADFLGGRGARRLPTIVVLIWVQLAGAVLAAAVFLLVRPDASLGGLLWGAGAGIVGAAAIGTFYAALAAGAMSLVAPLAACGAVLPASVAIIGGESPSTIVVIGFVLALAGGALVASEPAGAGTGAPLSSRALALAVAAAVLIGLLLTVLQHASQLEGSSALTAVAAARASSVVVIVLLLLAVRQGVRVGRTDLAPLVVAGIFDTSANALFAIATTKGSDAVAAVLGSLYPVMTVVLAAAVLHERVARFQAAGIVVALTGVVLVSAG